MYLSGDSLRNIISKDKIIIDYDRNRINNISYDLTIKEIIFSNNNYSDSKSSGAYFSCNLNPSETVFVSSTESIYLPNNCFATVIPRNSCIRQGIDICAPVYQPGHKTRIFIRVTNVSENIIHLNKGDSLASLMIYKLDADVDNPYQGIYKNEFTYNGLGKFHSSPVPKISKIEKKIDSIKDLEKSIYSTVITIMTVFISIFSLINLNANFLHSCTTVNTLVSYNLITVGSIFALIGLIVGVLAPRNTDRKVKPIITMIIIFIVSAVMIGIAILLIYKVK